MTILGWEGRRGRESGMEWRGEKKGWGRVGGSGGREMEGSSAPDKKFK